ncbi:MAG: glycosyltransferase, partial [Bacteroidota bacterium]
MTKAKHLLFITPGFPENEADTRCIPPLQDLALALHRDDRFQVSVIALHYPYRRHNYQWNGLEVHPIGMRNRPTLRPTGWMRVRRIVKRLQAAHPIDRIHSFWLSEAALLGQEFSAKYAIPNYCTLMGQDARTADRFQKQVDPTRVNIAALSQFHAQTYTERTGVQPEKIIPWGLPEFKRPSSTTRNIDLVGVGNLITLKQYDHFIEVVHQLKIDFPDIKAKLIGEGPLMRKLQFEIQRLGLSNHIELTGHFDRQTVLEYLHRSKLFLHTSSYESYGMVITEALAMGCHVVSRPVGIASELARARCSANS